MTQSKDVSDEMLMALADDELPAEEARSLRDLIARDSALAARFAGFADSRALLQEAFPHSPVPDRLIDTIVNSPTGAEDPQPSVLPFRHRAAAPVWGMALAASIVLAVGGVWIGRGTAPPALPVRAEVTAIALADTPTGGEITLPDGSIARALGSYETDLGLCRLISHADARHLVCRDDESGEWAAALSIAASDTSGFLPASDMATGLIDQMLDEIGAGPALTPVEEQELLHL